MDAACAWHGKWLRVMGPPRGDYRGAVAALTSLPAASVLDRRRSMADDVRERTDEQLATLLRRRQDLARPAPADLSSLAARASTRASVQRAVDSLDLAHLQVLEAAVAATSPLDTGAVGGPPRRPGR